MKAILQKIPTTSDSSFAVQNFNVPYFNIPWHFHPEFELVLVRSSTGKKFIGDTITDFEPGSLVLLGSNLPHWYRNDDSYYQTGTDLKAISLVIQFTWNFLGNGAMDVPEFKPIKKLLEKASMGLEITGDTRTSVTSLMKEMNRTSGMDRMILLLSILNILSRSGDYCMLSTQGSIHMSTEDSKRINRIYEYVMNNFTDNVSTEDVSAIVNMCPSAFCRYFKKRTRKTFTSFLNEIRIGHACKLLVEDDAPVTDICFLSGFNNISYFNRQFRHIKGHSPKAYRNEYLKSKSP
jgi:AraC-like DNA-binding protein